MLQSSAGFGTFRVKVLAGSRTRQLFIVMADCCLGMISPVCFLGAFPSLRCSISTTIFPRTVYLVSLILSGADNHRAGALLIIFFRGAGLVTTPSGEALPAPSALKREIWSSHCRLSLTTHTPRFPSWPTCFCTPLLVPQPEGHHTWAPNHLNL